MTVISRAFAICTTAEPTAPAAAETNTVSPGLALATRSRPIHAVPPVSPILCRKVCGVIPAASASAGSLLGIMSSPMTPPSRHPPMWRTRSPGAKPSILLSTTSPIAPPVIGWSIWKLAA